jgi:hypothetical protein
MDTSSAAPVVERIGAIEDAMLGLQSELAAALEHEELHKEALDALRASLMERAEGSSADDRKAWVERALMAEPPMAHEDALDEQPRNLLQWYSAFKARRKKLDKEFDVLAKRLSAGQSILKQFQHDTAPRFGAGQRNT